MLIEKNKIIFMFLVIFSAQNSVWSMKGALLPLVGAGIKKTGLTELSKKGLFVTTNFFNNKLTEKKEFVVDITKVPAEKTELYNKNAIFASTRLDHLYDKDGYLDIKAENKKIEFLAIITPLFKTPLINALKIDEKRIEEKIFSVGFNANKKLIVEALLKEESLSFHQTVIQKLLTDGAKIQDTTDELNKIIQNRKDFLQENFDGVRDGVLNLFPKGKIENESIEKFKTKIQEHFRHFDNSKNHDSFDEMYTKLKNFLSAFNDIINKENRTFVETIQEKCKDVKLVENSFEDCKNNFINHIKDIKQDKNVIQEKEFNEYKNQLVNSLEVVFNKVNKDNVNYGKLKNKLDKCINDFEFKSEARGISENFQNQLDKIFQCKVVEDGAYDITVNSTNDIAKNTPKDAFKQSKIKRDALRKETHAAIDVPFENADNLEKDQQNFKKNIIDQVNNIDIIKNITGHFEDKTDDASVDFKTKFEEAKTDFANHIYDSSRKELKRTDVEGFMGKVSNLLCDYVNKEHDQNQLEVNNNDVNAFVKTQKDAAENEHKLKVENGSKNFTKYINPVVESFIWGYNPLIGGAAVGTRFLLNRFNPMATQINNGKKKMYETTKNIFGENTADKAAWVGNQGNAMALMMTLVIFNSWLFKKTNVTQTAFFKFFEDIRNKILEFTDPAYEKFWNGVEYAFAPKKKNS